MQQMSANSQKRTLNSWFRFNPLTEIHNAVISVQHLGIRVPAMKEHVLWGCKRAGIAVLNKRRRYNETG